MSSNPPGYSVLVMGESGTGKSHFIRSALIAERSGAVALAPGSDEWNSYDDLAELDAYSVKGFEEWNDAVAWLKAVYKANRDALADTGELRHRIIAVDTYTGFDQLAVNRQLTRMGLADIPQAMSPDGAGFYTGLRKDLEFITSLMRALRGLGMHWLAAAHTQEKEVNDGAATQLESGKKQFQPVFRGGFRSIATAPFDMVLHSDKVKKDQQLHYVLRWRSGAKKAAKVRGLDGLGDSGVIRNEWPVLMEKVAAARARRKAALEAALAA